MCSLISSLLISPSEQTYSAGHRAFISLAGGGGLVAQSCLTLCDPHGLLARQAPLSMGFSRQEYWNGLPCPTPEPLPDPGIKPGCLLHHKADSLLSEPPGKPLQLFLGNTSFRIQPLMLFLSESHDCLISEDLD